MQLCGLWVRKAKGTGKSFMAGNIIGDLQLMVFKNDKKRPGSKDPDYQAIIVLPRAAQQTTAEGREPGSDDVPF